MAGYYTKRAVEILKEEGFVELSKKSIRYFLKKIWKVVAIHNFRFCTFTNHVQNRIQYDAPPHPHEIIHINPKNDIKYVLRRDDNDNLLLPNVDKGGLGQIRGGDWDSPEFRIKIEECLHDGNMYFVERFEHCKPIEETNRYQYLADKYNGSKIHKKKGFQSVEDYVLEILGNYDNMYEDIKDKGYKQGHQGTNKIPNNTQPVQDELETLVTIDRWGNINHWEGQHRKGIARALDIEIPAQVVCRHKKWQEVRDEIHRNGFSENHKQLRDHPDLQDIVD